jgi:hypothetical protein
MTRISNGQPMMAPFFAVETTKESPMGLDADTLTKLNSSE